MRREYTLLIFANIYFCLEESDGLSNCRALGGVVLPASTDHLPRAIRELRVARTSWSTSLQHRIHSRNLALVRKWSVSGKNLIPSCLRIYPEKKNKFSTHLPSQDAKRVHVTGRRSPGISQLEALGVNQFRSRAMEEPVDIYPWHSGWEEGCSETCDPGMSARVDEDICLNECEWVIDVRSKERTILRFP